MAFSNTVRKLGSFGHWELGLFENGGFTQSCSPGPGRCREGGLLWPERRGPAVALHGVHTPCSSGRAGAPSSSCLQWACPWPGAQIPGFSPFENLKEDKSVKCLPFGLKVPSAGPDPRVQEGYLSTRPGRTRAPGAGRPEWASGLCCCLCTCVLRTQTGASGRCPPALRFWARAFELRCAIYCSMYLCI